MESLPYVDEHVTNVPAGLERTWAALVSVVSGELGSPVSARAAKLLGWVPARRGGDWDADVSAGAALPGFVVDEAHAPSRLALSGRHRFSRYSLVFELEALGPERARVRARTRAAFPGPLGRAYRVLVIASGAHRIVVRRLLARVARRA